MIFRVIRHILDLLPQVTQQGADDWERKRARLDSAKQAKPRLLDLVEARALSEEARKQNMRLSQVLKQRKPDMKRVGQRESVRHKVDALIAPYYKHPEIMDEITEKLVDAAEHDPFYKRWFA